MTVPDALSIIYIIFIIIRRSIYFRYSDTREEHHFGLRYRRDENGVFVDVRIPDVLSGAYRW